MLAHELRNPLAPIRNAVSLMQLGGLSGSMVEWYRTVIDRQVTHLTRRVDDLLDASRITSGKITLRRGPVELAFVVESAADSSRLVVVADHEEVAVVLRQDPAFAVDGERRIGGADGEIEEEVVAQRTVRADGVEVAVLAVDEDVALAVDRRGVDAPLEAGRVIRDTAHVALGVMGAALGAVFEVPIR